jgi:hypothetical protein
MILDLGEMIAASRHPKDRPISRFTIQRDRGV